MGVLLDEQLPRQLAPYFVDHEVRTVHQESWAGLKNGLLLTKAEEAGFEVLITGDKNMPFQQNIGKRRLGVLVMGARSNAIEDLVPVVPNALVGSQRFNPVRWSGLRPGARVAPDGHRYNHGRTLVNDGVSTHSTQE